MCEGLIFLYLGLGLLSFGVSYDFRFILASIVSIFVGRLHVFLICGATSRLPAHKPVPWNQQVLVYMSGLRGAVAFALGVTLLENESLASEIKDTMFGTTVMTILFTVLGLGGIMPYLLKWLRIADPIESDGHAAHPDLANRNIQVPEDAQDEILSELDLQQPLFGWLFSLDVRQVLINLRYIRPYFSHTTEIEVKKKEIVRKHEYARSRVSMYGESISNIKDESILMTIRSSPTSEGRYKKLEDDDIEDLSASKKSITRSMPIEEDARQSTSRPSSPERGATSRLDSVNLE